MDHCYTSTFFEEVTPAALRSAEVIVPLVLNLIPAHSVVDIGCGEGAWLAVFRRHGVKDILGIDGDYVDRNRLLIGQDRFEVADLSKPLELGRTFDLAVSLEVAEHLPAECAAGFVESLTRLAPIILFSAAIPFQGGTHHVNEQWPDVWAADFKKLGYVPVDAIRRHVWQNEAVEWWYAQNALLFIRSDVLEHNADLKAEFRRTDPAQLRLVHPKQFLWRDNECREALSREAYLRTHPASGVKQASRILWDCIKNAVRTRVAE